jgi:hypothetical protein
VEDLNPAALLKFAKQCFSPCTPAHPHTQTTLSTTKITFKNKISSLESVQMKNKMF